MADESVGRRLLSALGGTAPAFTTRLAGGGGRGVLSALAGSTVAFRPGQGRDEYTPGQVPESALAQFVDAFCALPAHRRLSARAAFSEPALACYELIVVASDLVRGLADLVDAWGVNAGSAGTYRRTAYDLVSSLQAASMSVASTPFLAELAAPLRMAERRTDAFLDALDQPGVTHSQLVVIVDAVVGACSEALVAGSVLLIGCVLRVEPEHDALAAVGRRCFAELRKPRGGRYKTRFDVEVTVAGGRVFEALRNMAGADLTAMELAGIPLGGVRWSARTRWPPAWEARILRDSVALDDGSELFEIRSGDVIRAGIDAPV